MSRASFLLVLCLIAIVTSGCARRGGRAVRLPSVTSGSTAQKPGGGGTQQVRDAVRSLKNQLATTSGTSTEPQSGDAAATVAPGAARPGGPGGVGTSGAWSSVETRIPDAPPGAASAGSGPRGRLLSRARSAVSHAGGGTWAGLLALCAAAAAVAVALVLRRSRHPA